MATTEFVAAATETDDSPEIAVVAVVMVSNADGDRGEWLAEWLPSVRCGDGLQPEDDTEGDLRFGTE